MSQGTASAASIGLYGQFRDANEYLGDSERLNALFAEDGYLFFRGVLKGVERVKADFIRVLQQQGVVKPNCTEPLWTGAGIDQIDDVGLYELPSHMEVLDDNTQVIEQIFGEPVFIFRSPTIRYALPNDPERQTPPHQDYFFVRINQSFRTLWVPLMDIDEQVGGLALAPGMHKNGLVDHVEAENVYSYIFRGRKQRGVALENVPQPWLTTDYHAGDLLIFHNLMIHWALPNRSDRVRLSIDCRAQPVDAARTWQAEKSIVEARRFRATAQRIATEEGASEELFEAVIIELMGRGLEPERAHIKSLMSELSAAGKAS
jgi:hypothetical protein